MPREASINNSFKFCTKAIECQKYSYFHLVYRFTMFSRLVALILILVLTISCDFRSRRQTTLLREMAADTLVNYNAVDVYPLFLDCNNCDTSEKQNLCFEMELARRLQRAFEKQSIGSLRMDPDTIRVDILVNTEGQISIAEIHKPESLDPLRTELDSLLYRSIAELPSVIQPALKRGIPVSSMYHLPIVVSTAD